MTEQLRIVSYGGGVQSTALLVLAAEGLIDFKTFLFCNVGDDSEHPDSIAYVREVAVAYGTEHGIEVHELTRTPKRGHFAGRTETLMGRLTREGSKSLPIPVRMANGAPGTRSCTADFKIRVVQRWAKAAGASVENPCVTAIGISTDEYQRATSRITEGFEQLEYPLLNIEWNGRVGLSRGDCMDVIRKSGLPMPRKSSCFFCPFHTPQVWAEMRRDEPDLFEKSAALEDLLNRRRGDLGKDPVYLTRFGKPLRQAIGEAQAGLFGNEWDADEGYRCGDVCDT